MKTIVFDRLPNDAKFIREEVFIKEQGFKNEFDQVDSIATHYVMYDDFGSPIAVCRSFKDDITGNFTIGRIAVMKSYRGQGLGKKILAAAEDEILRKGGTFAVLHAQIAALKFYEACGYFPFGDPDFDEDCPHIWMKKALLK